MKKLIILLIVLFGFNSTYAMDLCTDFKEVPYNYSYGTYSKPVNKTYLKQEYDYYLQCKINPYIIKYTSDDIFVNSINHFHQKMISQYSQIFQSDAEYYQTFKQSLMLKMIAFLLATPKDVNQYNILMKQEKEEYTRLVQSLSNLGGDELVGKAIFYAFRVLNKGGAFKDYRVADIYINRIMLAGEVSEYNYFDSEEEIEDIAKYNENKPQARYNLRDLGALFYHDINHYYK